MDTTTNIPVSATAASFLFPNLKTPELILCLEDCGIEINEMELNEPHRYKDKLRKVFLRLLELCTGKTEDDFCPSAALKDKVATFSNPELFQDCWNDVLFFQSLRRCMETCGIGDFSLRDLHFPTAPRFHKQCSAFINMVKFREDQLKFYLELHAPRAKLLLNLEELKNEHTDLLNQLEDAKHASAERHHQREEVMKECEELELEIAHYNQLQRSQRQVHNELKKQATDLQDQLKAAVWEMQEVQSQEAQLQAAVVSSPERRLAQLEQAKQRLAREKKECQTLKEKHQQLQRHSDKLMQALQTMEETFQLALDVRKASRQYQEADQKLQAVQRQLDDLKLQANAKAEDVAHAKQMLQTTQNQYMEWRRVSQEELERSQQELAAKQAELAAAEQDRLADVARIQQGQEQVQRLEQDLREQDEQEHQEMDAVVTEFENLQRTFRKRNQQRAHMQERSGNVNVVGNNNNVDDDNVCDAV